jgi:hypothetical protein
MGFLSSLFGFDDAKPAQSTVVQATSIPEELKPFVTEVLESSQQQFQDDIAKGYTPFTGKTTADFTPEELQSMDRITGLAGVVDPYIREAETIARQGAREFTGDEVQKYMSPYQQAVTDIEKREAQRNFEGNILPRLEAQAVLQGGGQSGLGSRAAIELSEAQRNQAQLLADIQAKGQQTAYRDAQGLFANQLAREQQLASNLGTTGTALFQSGLAEAGALEGVGANKRSQEQNLLDEAFFRFKEEEAYPQQQLAEYTQNVYGNPVLGTPSRTTTTTGTPFQPSTGQNLLGLGLTGLNIYGMGGGFGAPNPNQFSLANIYNPPRRKAGGKVGGGLNSLPVVNRRIGGLTDPDQYDIPEMNQLRRSYGMQPVGTGIIPTSQQLQTQTLSAAMNAPENRDVNINIVRDREEKSSELKKALMQKSNAELDALDEAYFAGRESNIKANPMARGAVIQKLIGLISGSEKGALGGFLEGAPDALKGISDLDTALGTKRSELAKDKFTTKRGKLKERRTENIKLIEEDRDLTRLYDSLPAKLQERLIGQLKTLKTLETNDAKALAALKKATADLKNKDREYLLKLKKFGLDLKQYKNVDLVNVDISKSKVIKDLMDQYDTHPSAAIAALDLAGIKEPRIKAVILSVLTKQSLAGKNKLTQKGTKITDNIDQLLIDINK